MMKRNILAVIVPALLVAGTANAAEIYNKDGNKVDLYGKAVGLHICYLELTILRLCFLTRKESVCVHRCWHLYLT